MPVSVTIFAPNAAESVMVADTIVWSLLTNGEMRGVGGFDDAKGGRHPQIGRGFAQIDGTRIPGMTIEKTGFECSSLIRVQAVRIGRKVYPVIVGTTLNLQNQVNIACRIARHLIHIESLQHFQCFGQRDPSRRWQGHGFDQQASIRELPWTAPAGAVLGKVGGGDLTGFAESSDDGFGHVASIKPVRPPIPYLLQRASEGWPFDPDPGTRRTAIRNRENLACTRHCLSEGQAFFKAWASAMPTR